MTDVQHRNFQHRNDKARRYDLLGDVTPQARARALRFLEINETDDQYPYVQEVTADGYIYIVGDGGTCVVTPDGQLDYPPISRTDY